MDLRPMAADERAAVQSLLRACRLPVDDLDTADIAFTVAANTNSIVGVAGLEVFEDAGLLRSVAVQSSTRGAGLGNKLTSAVEAQAKARGLKHLVLLTETAAPFFAKRGYVVIPREQAPIAIQQSAEFRSLCPASATCMIQSLEPQP